MAGHGRALERGHSRHRGQHRQHPGASDHRARARGRAHKFAFKAAAAAGLRVRVLRAAHGAGRVRAAQRVPDGRDARERARRRGHPRGGVRRDAAGDARRGGPLLRGLGVLGTSEPRALGRAAHGRAARGRGARLREAHLRKHLLRRRQGHQRARAALAPKDLGLRARRARAHHQARAGAHRRKLRGRVPARGRLLPRDRAPAHEQDPRVRGQGGVRRDGGHWNDGSLHKSARPRGDGDPRVLGVGRGSLLHHRARAAHGARDPRVASGRWRRLTFFSRPPRGERASCTLQTRASARRSAAPPRAARPRPCWRSWTSTSW
ncbi:PP112 [Orf virus]|uniref:PP112 n=1 Tax=Orf virus TaxID=10258 RepID=F1AWY3_ORFV|nr:PP112 [Orf virus]